MVVGVVFVVSVVFVVGVVFVVSVVVGLCVVVVGGGGGGENNFVSVVGFADNFAVVCVSVFVVDVLPVF